jgi:hypothetical protein
MGVGIGSLGDTYGTCMRYEAIVDRGISENEATRVSVSSALGDER